MYFNQPESIKEIINKLRGFSILWLDTEIADWQTSNPKLSLIQVLSDPKETSGNNAYVLDVLEKPELINLFIQQIIREATIEKVFHNAAFDLKYLEKDTAKNITCTYKIAQKISKKNLGTSNLKLKTLAIELCQFSKNEVDTQQQTSDWGTRPLSEKQLYYAEMDVVYLAHVHQYLLNFKPMSDQNSFPKFTVSDVRVAFECPRLFYLSKHFGGRTLFVPSNQPKGIGQPFHKLADKFIKLAKTNPEFKELFKPSAKDLDVEYISQEMQRLFYEQTFFPILEKVATSKPETVPALQQVWEGLRGLINHWAELLVSNRFYSNYHNVISKTFVSQELSMTCDYPLPKKKTQKIEGKFDTLIRDLKKDRFCMVEYKTYAPVDSAAQLAQVALYSYILHLQKQQPVDSAVYCVLPEFKNYYYTWEELKDTVHELTPFKLQQMRDWLQWEPSQPDPPPETNQPEKLCPICPQKETCQSYFPKENQIIPSPAVEKEEEIITPSDEPIETEELGKQLENILQAYGVGVDYQGAIVGASFIRLKLKPHLGVKVVSILNRATDIQVQMGLSNLPLIAPQAGYISVDLPREKRQVLPFQDYIQRENNGFDIKIAIGVDLEGKLIEADLSDANTCHFLVGGGTGSGKSEFLKSLVLSLIERHTPEQVKIALVDPKRVTFPDFENSDWLMSPIIKERDRAIEFMEELVSKMEERYHLLEKAKCADLKRYNQQLTQQGKNPVPHLVCVFDEYADFMADKEIAKQLESSIKRLGGMARAAGIHLIISTQRPEAKIVTPIIRSNLPGRVALKTNSEGDSKIILGGNQTEAAYLLGKGDLLYLGSGNLLRLQSLLAST
ncbi:cell division protein FtsK [Euhalothece natronophila Z-M001]|uniref:Cell division protein FtsK n=1 Tax=Euhalothece natronophila Z-M001 TaxID=522448 RepID=A0A5B8NS19_9CHRO|nr:DNA translocase FtsK [Euhalothece natronophila]QDZ41109.1 cell division protein FtsK [Euhalothece natronophila Z-M001]